MADGNGSAGLRLGIDVGGTFTDLAAYDAERRELITEKVLTTPRDPAQGALEGVRKLAVGGLDTARVTGVVHGTTLVSNALIERRGARTALLTTRGFSDVLSFGRELRYDVYDPKLAFPEPLVPRSLRFEVPERLTGSGDVGLPLDEEEARAAISRALAAEPESLAVVLLHSYLNPAHELRVAALIAEQTDLPVSLSHQVLPQMREYERASATVINSYVQPLFRKYLRRLCDGLLAEGCEAPVLLMTSSGGTIDVPTAERFPLQLVESGPAAGTLIAKLVGEQLGLDSILSFDMGGTTAKASAIREGRPVITRSHEIARIVRDKRGSGLPVGVPVIDLLEIGGGGGSIASVDAMGLLTVGPRSAGSEPGPACYGRGGTQPTVTDANVVLGLIDPERFLGGAMSLDVEAARRAIGEGVGRPLGLDQTEAAAAVNRVVTESMTEAARVHAAEMNVDVRRCAMVCFGGAGPLHAHGIARRLGIDTIVCPPAAGVLSAAGLLTAPLAFEFVRSHPTDLAQLDFERVNQLLAELEGAASEVLGAAGVEEASLEHAVDMCYVGQGFEVPTSLPDSRLSPEVIERLKSRFDDVYEDTYGRRLDEFEARCVTWRVLASGEEPRFDPSPGSSPEPAPQLGEREVHVPDHGTVTCAIYDRAGLAPGDGLAGPALVIDASSTLVVPPGTSGAVDGRGNLILTSGGASD